MKKNKKILIVIGSFKIGGAERMAINIGEELLRRGYNVHFAIQKPIFQIPFSFEEKRIHVLNKKLESGRYYHHSNNIIQINRLSRKFKPEVVIAFTYFSSFLSCFTFCKNIIATFDVNPYSLGKKRHRVADFALRWPTVKTVIGPSKGTVRELKEARPSYSYKFKTIYNSIDFDKVAELAGEDLIEPFLKNKPYIAAMGRLSKQKNFSLLISSYAKSEIKDQFNLVIVGDGPQKDTLISEIDKFGLKEKIFLLGFKSNPYPYLRHSEFFINTSNYESFCIVILEALSLDKMVVATDCYSGPSEMITHNFNGMLIEKQNEEELIKALNTIAVNPEFLKLNNQNARKSVDKFLTSNIGEEWQELIESFDK